MVVSPGPQARSPKDDSHYVNPPKVQNTRTTPSKPNQQLDSEWSDIEEHGQSAQVHSKSRRTRARYTRKSGRVPRGWTLTFGDPYPVKPYNPKTEADKFHASVTMAIAREIMARGFALHQAVVQTIFLVADKAVVRLLTNGQDTRPSDCELRERGRGKLVHQLARGVMLISDASRFSTPAWSTIFDNKDEREVLERAVFIRHLGGYSVDAVLAYKQKGCEAEEYLEWIEQEWLQQVLRGDIPCLAPDKKVML